ncbi:hypothetical protein KSU07_00260 [Fusobacterium animalis]
MMGKQKPLEKTATFNGTLTLHGTPNAFTGSTAHSDVTNWSGASIMVKKSIRGLDN